MPSFQLGVFEELLETNYTEKEKRESIFIQAFLYVVVVKTNDVVSRLKYTSSQNSGITDNR